MPPDGLSYADRPPAYKSRDGFSWGRGFHHIKAPWRARGDADSREHQEARTWASLFQPWCGLPHFNELLEKVLRTELLRSLFLEVTPPYTIPIVGSGMNPLRQEAMYVPWQKGDVLLGFKAAFPESVRELL